MTQPIPFTIVRHEGEPPAATNGKIALTCPDAGGVVKLRRGIRGVFGGATAERVLPHLNALAGELLSRPDMPPDELEHRLHVLGLMARPPVPQNIEWAYAELDGVRAYTDGQVVILTKQDLRV